MSDQGISIVIPVHNSARYLKDCINSVLSQVNEHTEILIIENGSTDNTPEICKKIAKEEHNIQYIEISAVGVSVARNTGIVKASKDYIIFLDSDDMLQPGAISIINKMMSNDIDILLFQYSNLYPKKTDSTGIRSVNKDSLLLSILQYRKNNKKLGPGIVDAISVWTCWGKCYRTAFLRENNVIFPENITHSEDTFFFFKAVNKAHSIFVSDAIVYFYRKNEYSVTRSVKCSKENNIRVIHAFENYRVNHLEYFKYTSEFNSFYILKVLDLLFLYDRHVINDLLYDPFIKNVIKNASIHDLSVGKKRWFKYVTGLLYLKMASSCLEDKN